MSESATKGPTGPTGPKGSQQQPDPKPGDHLPPGSPDGLVEGAGGPLEGDDTPEGRAENSKKEAGALDFMLSSPAPMKYTVTARVDTPEGLKELIFHMHQLDGRKIEEIELSHSDGVGPFAKVDRQALNVQKIDEACDLLEDKNGKTIKPSDPEFIGDKIGSIFAFESMFKHQPGVAESISAEIDRMAGMTRDRVDLAEREMATAVGNS